MLARCTRRAVCAPHRRPLEYGRLARLHAEATPMTGVAVYLEEVAVVSSPPRLDAYLKVLEVQGARPLAVADRQGLHPLMVPLMTQPGSATSGSSSSSTGGTDPDVILGFLRWPNVADYKGMTLPLVSMARGDSRVKLLARSVDEQLHRLLAEEDVAGGPGPIAEAAGELGRQLYQAGQAVEAGVVDPSKLPMYLVRKVGAFPDVCEALAMNHLRKNDERGQVSALVASDWYMRNNFFPGWARPFEFAAELLMSLKRPEEARDMARAALRQPWWSMRGTFEDVQKVAQIPGDPQAVQHALSEAAQAQSQASVNKVAFRESRTTQQLSLVSAANLLDLACIGAVPGGYAAVRGELAGHYRAAGLSDVANFLEAVDHGAEAVGQQQ